ncbi:unnamed protein product [Calypogeia fissa]
MEMAVQWTEEDVQSSTIYSVETIENTTISSAEHLQINTMSSAQNVAMHSMFSSEHVQINTMSSVENVQMGTIMSSTGNVKTSAMSSAQNAKTKTTPSAENVKMNTVSSAEVNQQIQMGGRQGEAKEQIQGSNIGQFRMVVHLESSAGETTACTVYIDRHEEKPLPNYGGYRDTRSGVHYLNAIAQTELDKKTKKRQEYITRENLKPEQKKQEQQTDRETWTQMDRPGVILDNRGDYVLIPGPYFTSDDWDQVRLEAAIFIQKYVRGSIARRTAHRIRAYAKERKEFWDEQERIRKLEAEEHLKYEIQRRMNPRSGDDFEILYTELASWCAHEINKINLSGKVGMERRKAIKELLLKEIKLLQTIDKLRCKAARENKKERIAATLTKMSIPKMWELQNGSVVHVRTLGTARASDLKNLYHALAKPSGTNDERMGVLGYVKWTVQVFNTMLTREILELIEREADLMMRGRPSKSLSGLRLRILNLFLQFVETPEFNPEAASQQYVPVDFDYGVNSQPTRKRGPG